MSDKLREFLQAWLDWALASEITVVESQCFGAKSGLCACLIDYTITNEKDRDSLEDELKWLFEADNLDHIYPFGKAEYIKGVTEHSQHLCPQRLDWVKGKLNG